MKILKNRMGILVIFCTIMIWVSSTTVASADYGFEWGFEVGDQFHFRKSGTPLIPIVDYYVEIDYIPFNITNFDNVTYDDMTSYLNFYTCYNEDGTEMDIPQTFMALPIGNWSAIQETYFGLSSILNITEWVNTETEWGLISRMNMSSLDSYVVATTTWTFSKIDGVMNLFRVVVDPEEGITATIQIERKYPQTGQILSPELIIGIGVGIVALVIVGAAVVVMKKR